MRSIILILIAMSSLIVAQATEWKTYLDENVGYSITYPALLHLIPPIVSHPEAGSTYLVDMENKEFPI